MISLYCEQYLFIHNIFKASIIFFIHCMQSTQQAIDPITLIVDGHSYLIPRSGFEKYAHTAFQQTRGQQLTYYLECCPEIFCFIYRLFRYDLKINIDLLSAKLCCDKTDLHNLIKKYVDETKAFTTTQPA